MRGHRLGLGLGARGPFGASALSPSLTSIDVGHGSAAGGGAAGPRVLTGMNLAGASVTVGGVSGTSVSSTSTTVTFTPPALSKSATPYDVVVTTLGGSATLSGAYYALPSGYVCHLAGPSGFTPSSWTDLSGNGANAVQATSGQQPSAVSSGINSQPSVAFNGNATTPQNMVVTFASSLSAISLFLVLAKTAATPEQGAIDGVASTPRLYLDLLNGSVGWFTSASTAFAVQPTLTSPHIYEYIGDTSTAVMGYDKLVPTQTCNVLTGSLTGLTIGSRYASFSSNWYSLVGQIAELIVYPSKLSSSDSTIVATALGASAAWNISVS